MKDKNIKPLFKNDQDPDVKSPEVTPELINKLKVELPESPDEKTIALNGLNITEADLLFIKSCKEQTVLTSDKTEKLWFIHLALYERWPQPDDKYCGACVQKAMDAVWAKVEPVYGKYYNKIIS